VPGAINTVAGVDIWRSNETTDGCNELYQKLEYGTGSVIAYPSIWSTSGWGRSGASLTGLTSTRRQSSMTNTANGNHRVSAGPGWANMFFSTNSVGMMSTIERTCSPVPFTFQDQVMNFFHGGMATQCTKLGDMAFPIGAFATNPTAYSSVRRGKIPVSFWYGVGRGLQSPYLNIIGVYPGSAGGLGHIVKHKAYGTFRSYIVCDFDEGNGLTFGPYQYVGGYGGSGRQILMRWE
jgi:hypothetical protein